MSTSTINTNTEINTTQNSSISPILTDLGAALVFGLGFYFFKSHFKKSTDEKDTKDKMKPLKEKIEDTLNKWDLEYTEKKSLTSVDSFLLNIKNIKKKIKY